MYGYNPYNQQQAMAYSQDMYNSRQYPQPQQPRPQFPQVITVPDELTARSAQIPMDGTDPYFFNSQAGEIYAKRLSMVDGSASTYIKSACRNTRKRSAMPPSPSSTRSPQD